MYYSDVDAFLGIIFGIGLILSCVVTYVYSLFTGGNDFVHTAIVFFVSVAFIFAITAILYASAESRTGTLTLHYADGDLRYIIEERKQNYVGPGGQIEEFVDINGTRGEINVPYDIVWNEE